MIERRVMERRIGERRKMHRRRYQRRRRPIPVVVDLRSGVERRELDDRRELADRRSGFERRSLQRTGQRRCDILMDGGVRCSNPATVRGARDQGWLCLEHLLAARKLDLN